MGPTASSRPPPGQRSRDPEMICRISCSLVWLHRLLSLLFFALSVFCFRVAGRVFQIIDRPSVGPKPSGSSSFYYVVVEVCYLGGGSLDGGDLASPRCLGPSRSTPEGCGAAHGPRHPAYPLLLRPVISSWGFRFLSSWSLGLAWVFRSEAEILCLFLFALQDPTPVRLILGFLSFLWLFGCFFVRRRRVSFFSLLQALGNHKPRCGLWFPLC